MVHFSHTFPGTWTRSAGKTHWRGCHYGAYRSRSVSTSQEKSSRPSEKELGGRCKGVRASGPSDNLARSGFIVNLTSKRFEGFAIDVIMGKGKRPAAFKPLSDFLISQFIKGELGDESIEYDARHEWLQWLDMNDDLVRCVFPCKQRISINVSPPPSWRTPATISPDEVPDHRLAASPKQILGVDNLSDVDEFKRAYRRKQHIYHTDKYAHVPQHIKDRLNRESQATNLAYASLQKK